MSYEANKRWRQAHPEVWQASKSRYYAKSEEGAIHKNRRWTQVELRELMAHSILDKDLAKKLGRSVRALQVQRAKVRARLDKGR